jgi:hypothetical protein
MRIRNRRNSRFFNSSIVDNIRRSLGKLRLSSRCNMRISNRRNSSLSSSKSVDTNRRIPGKLLLSSSCNMRISNRQIAASPAAGGGAHAISP